MIRGSVTPEGVPQVMLEVDGFEWPALVDTGFNGDLELPNVLRRALNARPGARVWSLLASGQAIEEDTYVVDFPFDGETIEASVTFAPVREILIGTRLLRNHRLEIDFPAGTVLIERAA